MQPQSKHQPTIEYQLAAACRYTQPANAHTPVQQHTQDNTVRLSKGDSNLAPATHDSLQKQNQSIFAGEAGANTEPAMHKILLMPSRLAAGATNRPMP
jgi:hypothetical protein